MRKPLLILVPSLASFLHLSAAETSESAPGTSLPAVTVTATRLDSTILDQPYAITRIERQQLDESGARTLNDALDASPGIHIQHTGQNQTSPYIRGLTGEQTLLLFDGVRFNHAMMRSGPNQYSAMIPEEAIGAVDIILGSSSTVTGSDGLTGAIDYRLAPAGRNVDRAASPWVQTRLASAEGGTVAGGLDGARGAWRWSVDGSYASFGTLRGGKDAGDHLFGSAAGDRDIPNTAYNHDSLGGRVAWDGWQGQTWELASGRSAQHDAPRPDGYFENSGKTARISRYYDPQVFSYIHARHRAHNVGPFELTQTTLWMHRHDEHQVREDIEGTGGTSRYRRREYQDAIATVGSDVQLTHRIAQVHELTWGGTAYIERTDNLYSRFRSPIGNTSAGSAVLDQNESTAPGGTTVPDGARYMGLGTFVQDLWTIAEDWDILTGLRWSRYDWSGDVTTDRAGYSSIGNTTVDGRAQALTGSARLGWHNTPVTMCFVGVGQGFRSPTISDLMGIQDRASSSSGGTGPQTQGNPDLDPEKSVTYEAGIKYADQRDSASLTIFKTQLKDLIQTVYTDVNSDGQITATDTAQTRNANDGELIGLEIANDVSLPVTLPDHWRISLFQSTNYVRGTVDVPQANLTTKEEYISRSNLFFGKAGVRLDLGARWYVLGQTRWSDAYDQVAPGDATDTRHTTFGGPDGSMPGFAVIDLMGGWHAPDYRYAVDCGLQNIGNTSYRPVGSGNDGAGLNAVIAARARF